MYSVAYAGFSAVPPEYHRGITCNPRRSPHGCELASPSSGFGMLWLYFWLLLYIIYHIYLCTLLTAHCVLQSRVYGVSTNLVGLLINCVNCCCCMHRSMAARCARMMCREQFYVRCPPTAACWVHLGLGSRLNPELFGGAVWFMRWCQAQCVRPLDRPCTN